MEELIIKLNPKDARKLLNCLIHPDPKGTDLDYQIKLEDILADYLISIEKSKTQNPTQ